jgi:hypothetical protein
MTEYSDDSAAKSGRFANGPAPSVILRGRKQPEPTMEHLQGVIDTAENNLLELARGSAHLLSATLEPWFHALQELYASNSPWTTPSGLCIRPFGLLVVLVSWIQSDLESCRAVSLRCLLEGVLPGWIGTVAPSGAAEAQTACTVANQNFEATFSAWLCSSAASGVIRTSNDKRLLQATEQQFVSAARNAAHAPAAARSPTSMRDLLREVAATATQKRTTAASLRSIIGTMLMSAHSLLPNKLDPGHELWVQVWLTYAATALQLQQVDFVQFARSSSASPSSDDDMSNAFIRASCLQLSLASALATPAFAPAAFGARFRCEAPPDFTDAQCAALQYFVHRGWEKTAETLMGAAGAKRAVQEADDDNADETEEQRPGKRSRSGHSSSSLDHRDNSTQP